VHVVVGFGGFKEADAAIVGVANEVVEFFLADVALHLAPAAAGAEGEAGDLEAGLAEGHFVGGLGRCCMRGERGGDAGEGGGSERGFQEVAAGMLGHGVSCIVSRADSVRRMGRW
jgi:hypothetical protein